MESMTLQMESMEAMTSEAIALAEKKMNMSLDDIIKMSKKSSSQHRASNKSKRFPRIGTSRGVSSIIQRFMDSRSSLRQGFVARKRSNFKGKQFPLAKEVATNAAVAPIHNTPTTSNWVSDQKKRRSTSVRSIHASKSFVGAKMALKQKFQTLDALFASMKELRMNLQERPRLLGSLKKVGLQATEQPWQSGGNGFRKGSHQVGQQPWQSGRNGFRKGGRQATQLPWQSGRNGFRGEGTPQGRQWSGFGHWQNRAGGWRRTGF